MQPDVPPFQEQETEVATVHDAVVVQVSRTGTFVARKREVLNALVPPVALMVPDVGAVGE